MTNLELCQALASEAGASGSAAAITTVVGQTGQALRIVNWIKRSHTEIQRRHDNWRWMRSRFTVNTVASDGEYAYSDCTDSRLSATITRFGRWIPFDDGGAANLKIYLTSGGVSGERWLVNIPWDYFQSVYRRGPQNDGPPVHVSIDPQDNLVLGPKPDAVYTVSGEYQMSAKIFSADSDTPEFPSDFHDLVFYRAMEKAGRFSAAGEVLARGQVEGARLMRQLENDQLPNITVGEPLA